MMRFNKKHNLYERKRQKLYTRGPLIEGEEGERKIGR